MMMMMMMVRMMIDKATKAMESIGCTLHLYPVALSTDVRFLDENYFHGIAIIKHIIMMTRLRGHYVADIRSGICDPNACPTIVKETAGEQKHSNNQDCHHVKNKDD